MFWVNVPIGLAVAALAPRLVLESHAEGAHRSFDFGGALSVTAGLSVLVYALVKAPDHGWGSTHTLGLIAVAAALIAIFVFIERRSIAPLVPFDIFRNRTLTGANVVGILTGAALFSMFFFVALYMRSVLGFSAIKTGVSYLPLALTIIASAGIASQLVTRIGFGVAHHEAGLASGLINTAQQVGGALGLAILSSIAFSKIAEQAAAGVTGPAGLTAGYSDAFLVGAGIALLGLVAAATLIRNADSKAHSELPTPG